MSRWPTPSMARDPSTSSTSKAPCPISRSGGSCPSFAPSVSASASSRVSSASTSAAWACPTGSPARTTLETRMDDIRAVMDAVGSEQCGDHRGVGRWPARDAVRRGPSQSGRSALILQGAEVRERTDEEWPWGENTVDELRGVDAARVPEPVLGQGNAFFSILHTQPGRSCLGAASGSARLPGATAATPGVPGTAFARMAFDIDVRHVAPSPSSVPTLIFHAVGDQGLPRRERALPGANDPRRQSTSRSPGADHVPVVRGPGPPSSAELREFLTGERETPVPVRSLSRNGALHRHRRIDRARAATAGRPPLARDCSRRTPRDRS